MWVLNRIVVVLLLAALFVLGVLGAVYSLNFFGYRLADVPQLLNLQTYYDAVQNFVGNVENGNLTFLAVFILVAVAIAGLFLLLAELKPPAPRRVRMDNDTYVTRNAVKEQVLRGADRSSEVLDSSARVKARRSPGAKVNLKAKVRRGEDLRSAGNSVRQKVEDYLRQVGVPVSRLKVKLSETDPRGAGKRVQ